MNTKKKKKKITNGTSGAVKCSMKALPPNTLRYKYLLDGEREEGSCTALFCWFSFTVGVGGGDGDVSVLLKEFNISSITPFSCSAEII
jgi:hypothetical protein